jgi:hypothetical protein
MAKNFRAFNFDPFCFEKIIPLTRAIYVKASDSIEPDLEFWINDMLDPDPASLHITLPCRG